ncbi:phage tail spike protein [Siminovitchia sp. FSL W7-1587]|uniref:phage tail spike protein n=1 Tax=Siminovitchia sp. FSL W7-1587 TaxID=2954699 RepID=UPI0030CAA13D
MALIHVLDKQTDEIIETLNNETGEYYESLITSSLENQNTFDFIALKKFDKLEKRNRLLVQDADGFFSEFIINYAEQYKRNEKIVKSDASFIDLKKAKVIEPIRLEGQTPETAAHYALERTEWQLGDIDFVNIRTITITDLTNPYDFLKQVASTFDLELRFRVEVKGRRIVGRYVDLKKQIAGFEGKEITFGKDLIGIKRVEDSSRIVTALLGVGPEKEDGSSLAVLVENEEALQRWGRNGQHLIEVYEPESSDQDMTEDRLRTLTQNELEKRNDAAVSYECEAVSLEHVFGRSHERIRLGQTVRIKDEGFNPPLYLEARIQEVQENPATRQVVNFKIGNFIEYKKEDLEKQIALLKKVLAQKVNAAELEALERALQGEISDINDALTDMDEYIEGAFSDGLIEKSEAQAIEKYVNSLNVEKAELDSQYSSIYDNAGLTGSAKTNLFNAKNAYNMSHSALINSINAAIADGKTTPSEKLDVDNKFVDYRSKLSLLSQRLEEALDGIAQAKASKALSDANTFTQNKINDVNTDITNINNRVNNLDSYIDGAFSDGIIEQSEAKAIEKYINSLNTEKTDVDNRYITVYNDADLTGTAKSNLYNAKLSFNTAYNSLVSSINSAIADGKTTPAEKQDVDNKFTAYRNAIGTLSTRFEQAIRAIEKMKADRVEAEAENFTRGYAETPTGAQQKANAAKEEANQHTDKQVETRVEKTKVIQRVNESPEPNQVIASRVAMDIIGQTGAPQAGSPLVTNWGSFYFTHEAPYDFDTTAPKSMFYIAVVHQKRKITVRLQGGCSWDRILNGRPANISGAKNEYAITKNRVAWNDEYILHLGTFTDAYRNETWEPPKGFTPPSSVQDITIDLGQPTGEMTFLYFLAKGNYWRRTSTENAYVSPYLRINYFRMHD